MFSNSTIEMSCCSLWTSLTPFIKETTGIALDKCPSTKEFPTACMEHVLMQRIVGSTHPRLMVPSNTVDTYLVNTDIFFSGNGISRMLAWSFIGRTCAEDRHTQVPTYYLEFNLMQQTLSLTRTGCEYEKILFTSMLGICIILLIFVMVVPLMFERRALDEDDDTTRPLTSSTTPSTTTNTTHTVHSLHALHSLHSNSVHRIRTPVFE